MGTDIQWIKITTDMFDNEKIRLIEKLPEGDMILIIWMKLLTLAGRVNSNGYIMLTESIPYTDAMLEHVFARPLVMIQLALKTFETYEMIHMEDSRIAITNWEKYQNTAALNRINEQNRLRQQAWRDRQKAALALPPAPEPEPKGKKKAYGEFNNVMLTDDEHAKLVKRFRETDTAQRIEELSIGIKSKGYKYKNHYAAILSWARKERRDIGKPVAKEHRRVQSNDSKESVATREQLDREIAGGNAQE